MESLKKSPAGKRRASSASVFWPPGRKVVIAAAPASSKTSRPGIHLQPGELRIEFFGAEDLLRQLFELSQAMVNDFGRFQTEVEEESPCRRYQSWYMGFVAKNPLDMGVLH